MQSLDLHTQTWSLHRILYSLFFALGFWFLAILLSGCISPQITQDVLDIQILTTEKEYSIQLPAGSDVQSALDSAGIQLNSLDIIDPPVYTVLSESGTIRVTQVTETFEVNDVVIPFDHKIVHNEALAEGETLLIQPGVNGQKEITYRRVFHDGEEISNQEYKVSVLKDPIPEILMVGVQTPFSAIDIPGRLAYLTSGNAWFMDGSTGRRLPIVTSGDLDGRIFSLSQDGKWLLFTRKSEKPAGEEINTLWVAAVSETLSEPIFLKASNIIHYAGWVPGKQLTVAYSTVEPRETSPGWQANNNLLVQTFSSQGYLPKPKVIVEPNSGGIYGWWGTNFVWSPKGHELAYARPDGIGLVDLDKGELQPVAEIVPYQTFSNWAWIPGLSWASDGAALYTANHLSLSGEKTEENSPDFDLSAYLFETESLFAMVPQTGMFAYPSPSPLQVNGTYKIAYLQAIFPQTSDTSKYRLVVMDQDGSNPQVLYPSTDSSGMEPQEIVWAPDDTEDGVSFLGVVYQGNIWLVSSDGKIVQQVTGDESVTMVDWR